MVDGADYFNQKKYLNLKHDENQRKCNVSVIHILLPFTQHLQYIFINFNKFAFTALLIYMLRCIKHIFIENYE